MYITPTFACGLVLVNGAQPSALESKAYFHTDCALTRWEGLHAPVRAILAGVAFLVRLPKSDRLKRRSLTQGPLVLLVESCESG